MEVGSDLIDDSHLLSACDQHCWVSDSEGVPALQRPNDEAVVLLLSVAPSSGCVVVLIESDEVWALGEVDGDIE